MGLSLWLASRIPASEETNVAEKVKELGLERDYKKYLYFIDKNGNVARKDKSGAGAEEVVAESKITREKGYLYFVDKEGDVSRSSRKAGKADAPAAEAKQDASQ